LDGHPVRITLQDDLRRSRLTVFFRLLLALPHMVWFFGWTALIQYAALLAWLWSLVTGRVPDFLHRFLASWIRYGFHVGAYIHLAANPFPGFIGRSGYPVDLVLPLRPERQRRLGIFFRFLLALPAILIAAALAGFAHGGILFSFFLFNGGLAWAVAVLGWFAAVALGRMPAGLRDAGVYGLGYAAQAFAYAFLVTGRYPNSDPEALGPVWTLPPHEVRLELADDGRRSRLTVLFRLLLTLPHFVWLTLWSAFALLAAVANWFVTLVRGRPAGPLHRFLSAFIRYVVQVLAFLFLVANPFPGFTGAGGYPLEVTLPPPERQNRWKTGFRGLLVFPAFFVAGAYASALYVCGILGWFYALVRGRAPTGMRNLGAVSLRYLAQTYAYLYLVGERYPYASPALRPPPPPPEPAPDPEPEPEPEPEPAPPPDEEAA
jgi:hypothetical protein